MKSKYSQIINLWKKSIFILGLGLLLGTISTHAATNCNVVTEISTVECDSLLELYHSTNGPNWRKNEDWNVTNTPCSWHGITCENNGVVEIDLSGLYASPNYQPGYHNRYTHPIEGESAFYYGNNLVGTIPDFSSLPNLKNLFLRENKLTGTIPDFSGLPNLQSLSLRGNKLTGEIPNFSKIPNLQGLYLGNNQLTGIIPDFGDLPNLHILFLGGNSLTIKPTDCNVVKNISQIECESLLQLYHSTNGANWEKPSWMYRIKVKHGWNVNNVPCTWYGITCENNGVVDINLSEIKLAGKIPDFNGLPNLRKLELNWAQLTGEIPNFSGLPSLQTLSLTDNQLTGQVPDFTNLPNLQELNLERNQLRKPIPNFTNLPNLQMFYLGEQLTIVVKTFPEKEHYRFGEHFRAELTETFSESYDLYAAVLLPNGVDFVALKNTNQFAPINQPQIWFTLRGQNKSITLLDLTLLANLATGKYCIYGILSPKDKPVLEVKERWVMDKKCFEINTIN